MTDEQWPLNNNIYPKLLQYCLLLSVPLKIIETIQTDRPAQFGIIESHINQVTTSCFCGFSLLNLLKKALLKAYCNVNLPKGQAFNTLNTFDTCS